MKKSIAFALLAALTIPSTAMALQPATRGIRIAGQPGGTGTSFFSFILPPSAGAPLGGCLHNVNWQSPAGQGAGTTLCQLAEINTLGSFCSPSANVPVAVTSLGCVGWLPSSVIPVPVALVGSETTSFFPTIVAFAAVDGLVPVLFEM